MPPEFTDRQRVFIEAYVAKRNATQAAIDAGYNPNSANEQASRLLAKDKIKREIDRRLEKILERYRVTPEMIVRELAYIARSNIGDYVSKQDDGSAIVDLSNTTPEQMAAISTIEVDEYSEPRGKHDRQGVKRIKLKTWDKRAALMDLAKIMRMLPADRMELTGANGMALIPASGSEQVEVREINEEQREQLRAILISTQRAKGLVTDVKDENDE